MIDDHSRSFFYESPQDIKDYEIDVFEDYLVPIFKYDFLECDYYENEMIKDCFTPTFDDYLPTFDE